MNQDQQLFDLVKTLSGRVKELEMEVRSLRLTNKQDVPEDILLAIAAGVAAYLDFRGAKQQVRFASLPIWVKGTRQSQLNHIPVR